MAIGVLQERTKFKCRLGDYSTHRPWRRPKIRSPLVGEREIERVEVEVKLAYTTAMKETAEKEDGN